MLDLGVIGERCGLLSQVGQMGAFLLRQPGGFRHELQEGLDYYSEKEMTYLYRLSKEKVDVLPVSSYTAEITVKSGASGGSLVTWMARLYRADTGNEPAPDKNDAAAVKAMKAYLTEGLQGLKTKAEAK